MARRMATCPSRRDADSSGSSTAQSGERLGAVATSLGRAQSPLFRDVQRDPVDVRPWILDQFRPIDAHEAQIDLLREILEVRRVAEALTERPGDGRRLVEVPARKHLLGISH